MHVCLLLLLAPARLGASKSDPVLVVRPHPVGILDLEREICTWKVVDVPCQSCSFAGIGNGREPSDGCLICHFHLGFSCWGAAVVWLVSWQGRFFLAAGFVWDRERTKLLIDSCHFLAIPVGGICAN